MDDENGLELSLGLSFGGSGSKVKDKDGSSSDAKSDEGSNSSKVMGDLKNFLNAGSAKQDTDDGSQRNNSAHAGSQTSQDNFFTNLTKSAHMVDTSKDLHSSAGQSFTARYGGLWDANNKPEVEEVKSSQNDMGSWLDGGNKRKMLFEETNNQKKHEREIKHGDALGRSPSLVISSVKTSHISVNTEDGSTAENEDVAESEVEGSTSRLVHQDEGTKSYVGGSGGTSEATKESHGHRQSNALPRNEPPLGNLTFGTAIQLTSEPYSSSSKVANVNGESTTSGFPLPNMMQLMPPKSNEGPGSQTVNPGNLPFTFGYSPVQLPTLDTEHSWGSTSHPQQLPPHFVGRSIGSVISNSDRSEDGLRVSREALADERKAPEATQGGGKQHAVEEGGASSSPFVVGSLPKEGFQALEGYSPECSAIRPGVAPDLKFGGAGTVPDLPWVSTTGPGPNGKTISGVTYKLDKNQIKIVCACHGSHMSPEEFVQHAGAENPENNPSLASFPSGNPAASARN